MTKMMRIWAAAIVISLLVDGSIVRAGDVTLVQDGKPAAAIIVPGSTEPGAAMAMTAAKVLSDHLFQMSGARLEIRTAGDLGRSSATPGHVTADTDKVANDVRAFVFVGECELSKQAGFSSEGLAAGGILVKTGDNTLGLIGSKSSIDPQAVQYAVIDCLESLGCRYLWPGESGKVIPKKSTVVVASTDHHYSPAIQQRGIRITGLTDRPLGGLQRLGFDKPLFDASYASATQTISPISWSTWQRLGGNVGIAGGAAGGGLRGGWKQWGATHPEWFALQMDGTRDQSKAGDRWRLCVSNQGLIDHVADDIIERAKENPKMTFASLCPNDGGFSSFCLCDECKKLDPPDAPKVKELIFPVTGGAEHKEIDAPALTDRYVHYWNAIAERVEKVYPNMLFLCEAYSYYSTPPVREKLNPNIIIRYVPGGTTGWEGWQKAGTKRIYWRPNILLAGRRDGMLHVMLDQLTDRMSFMADNGMFITDFDSIMNNWAVNGLNYYATARLNWNPHLTSDQILDDYCLGGFGPAGQSVKQYFLRVEAITLKEDRKFTPEKIVELRKFLDDADKSAGDDDALHTRIAFLRYGLNYTDLFSTLTQFNADAADKTGPELKALQAKAKPLLDLNILTLRDTVKNHNLADNMPYLMYMTNDFANFEAIGGRGYRPGPAVLALGDNHSLTGREDSLEAMKESFGLTDAASLAAGSTTVGKGDTKVKQDADENGKVGGK